VRPTVDPIRAVPENYPKHLHIPLKYADQDPSGDVNGIAIGRLFEEARYTARSSIDADEARDPHIGFVLARVRIDILAPVRYPGSVAVCIGIAGVGRTSFSYASAMFQDGPLVAVSDATVAVRDRRTGTGYVLTPQFHAALTPMLLRTRPAKSA
jgi:acyl-CoA thioester hydrolase